LPADEEFLAVRRDIEDAQPRKRAHPTGWEPGVDTAARTLTVVSEKASPPQEWADIIRELGLDPTAWTVDETQPCQVRSWDSGSQRLYYYRATILPIREQSSVDVEQLVREIKRHKPKPKRGSGDAALVVALADWQAGKPEGGGATALVERLLSLRDELPRHLKRLRRQGVNIGSLYVTTMGDLVEGCGGHYEQQTYAVELDRRQQVKLVRRMLVEMISEWSKHVERVVVGAVPGNHGENRRGSKSFTTFEDNDDLAVVEQAAEILSANSDAFDHVRFVIPDGDMTITLDIAGTVVAFAHGHQARGSGKPQSKVDSWWKGKQHAQHPVGDASILVTGHYHHLTVVEDGPRTWFQCPANDGGSRWFEEGGGTPTRCGTLTFVVDDQGWSNMEVLR
jgi:predicted phosphodiesterase